MRQLVEIAGGGPRHDWLGHPSKAAYRVCGGIEAQRWIQVIPPGSLEARSDERTVAILGTAIHCDSVTGGQCPPARHRPLAG
jgi:hypothetical protein